MCRNKHLLYVNIVKPSAGPSPSPCPINRTPSLIEVSKMKKRSIQAHFFVSTTLTEPTKLPQENVMCVLKVKTQFSMD